MDHNISFYILYIIFLFNWNSRFSAAQSEAVVISDLNKITCGADKNTPIVELRRNVRAKPPVFKNLTNIQLLIPVQELIFLCNATYPIEWAFPTYLVQF